MERRANYTLVGAFVLIFGVALTFFIFWIGKYGGETKEFDCYKTYFNESVSGLNKESPIKFKGLDVGAVEKIEINPNNPEEIEVFFKVRMGTPIKTDSFLMLGSQGLTGLSYLEIKGGTKNAPELKLKSGERPVIRSEKSLFSKLGDGADSIAQKLSLILSKIDLVLNENNVNNIQELISNANTLTKNISDRSEELKEVLDNAVLLEKSAKTSIEMLPKTLEDVNRLSQSSTVLIEDLQKSLAGGDYNIKEITKESIYKLNETLDEVKILMQESQQMVKSIKESPSDIIFKQKSQKPGPGETK